MAERELVTQAEYARRRNVSREAVGKRTTTRGGPIPVHGPRKLIDVAEADALWAPTITTSQDFAGNSRFEGPDEPAPAPAADVHPQPAAPAQTAAPEPPDLEELDDTPPVMPAPGEGQDAITPAARAKLASAVIRAQREAMELEEKRGSLVSKALAIRQVFGFARRTRDAWLNWPGRIAPGLAAELGVDQHVLTAALERHVRDHLTDLAGQPAPDFGAG